MESGSLEFAFLPFSFCKKTPACNPLSRLYFLPLASSGFRNRIETSNFKSLGLVQVKSGSQLQIQDRHYGPSKKKKIPPELTNRYVKNEAFIVVVFDNILTLLLTIRITILSDCYCCCFQVGILTRLALLSMRTLLPIVSVATHLPTAFQYSKDIQISGHLNI